MANGNSAWFGADFDPPKSVKVAVYLFQHLGVLGIIVAVFFGWLPSPMLDTHQLLKKNQAITHQLLNSNASMMIENVRQGDEIVYLLRRACVNGAQTEEAEKDCLRRNAHVRAESH